MNDHRLRGAVIGAAPKIAAAVLHRDAAQLDRELRRLETQCGYMVSRRALDAAVHCPDALKHALAVAAPGFARAAASGKGKEATTAALHFVEALLGQGLQAHVRTELRRLPVADAVREALVRASPGAVLAAAQGDGYLARNVAGRLAADVVRAKVAPHLASHEGVARAALEVAPSAALAAVRRGTGDPARVVVEFVGRAGLVSVDHIADKFVRANHQQLFPAKDASRAFVRELVLRNYLQQREFVLPVARSLPGIIEAARIPEPRLAAAAGVVAAHPVWQQAWTHVVHVTPRAAGQYAVPLPPDLRQAFIPHYLRTMDACLALEKRFEAGGFEVVSITGENQLIRAHFSGQVFRQGRVVPKFPDAQLMVRGPDGNSTTVNVEYVTKSYTPEMIRAKAHSFSGPTVWAVDSRATAAKVAANVSHPDLLLV